MYTVFTGSKEIMCYGPPKAMHFRGKMSSSPYCMQFSDNNYARKTLFTVVVCFLFQLTVGIQWMVSGIATMTAA